MTDQFSTDANDPVLEGTAQRVADHLRVLDSGMQPLRSDLGSIQDRAAAQQRGRHGGTMVLALVALVALGGVGWFVTRTQASNVVAGSELVESNATGEIPRPAEAAPGGAAAGERSVNSSLQISWDEHESPLGYFHLSAVNGGTMYVVSTAPGVRWSQEREFIGHLPQALYISENGKDWSEQLLDEAMQISDLSARDGVVYAIATSPLNNRGGRLDDGPRSIEVVSTSDKGQSWDSSTIESTAQPPTDTVRFQAHSNSQIAAGEAGVLVSVNTNYWADFLTLAPAEFRNPNKFYAEPRPDGLHIMDQSGVNEIDLCMQEHFEGMEEQFMELEAAGDATPEDFQAIEEQMEELQLEAMNDCGVGRDVAAPNQVAMITWEELGFNGLEESRVTEVFFSIDGKQFEQVDAPELSGAQVGEILVLGPHFLITAFQEFGGSKMYLSSNGTDWEELDAPRLDWVMSAGEIDGRLVLMTQGRNGRGEALYSDDDGKTWQSSEVGGAAVPGQPDGRVHERWMAQTAVGSIGVVAVFETFTESEEQFGPSYEVYFSPDAVSWELAAQSKPSSGEGSCCPSLSGSLVTDDEVVVNVASSNSERIPSFAFVGTPK